MNEGREMNVELMGQQTYNQLPRNLKILIFNEAGHQQFNNSFHSFIQKQKFNFSFFIQWIQWILWIEFDELKKIL